LARSKPARSASKSFASAADAPSSGASDVTTGWVTLLVGLFICGFLYYINHDKTRPMGFHEYNLVNTAFVLWIPLMVGMLFLRREPNDIGFSVGDLGKGTLAALVCFVLFCPVIYYFAAQPGPQAYYLRWMWGSGAVENLFRGANDSFTGGRIDPMGLAFHEIIMGFYMFGWEFFFRGFLLSGFRKIMPFWGAVLLQAFLFMGLHYGKPPEETLSSFPGAILMALLANRFRSFLPCFLLHWFVSAGFDFAVLYHHFK
jgi:membrane protease YdiL (CAAX protease family)